MENKNKTNSLVRTCKRERREVAEWVGLLKNKGSERGDLVPQKETEHKSLSHTI